MRLRPWPDLRRLAASLMLLAMTAFVLHGTAMAKAVGPAGFPSSVGHVHAVGGGHHHLAADHDHADAAHGEHHQGDHHGKGGSTAPCCGSMCAGALPSSAPGCAVTRIQRELARAIPDDRSWSGLDPSGLKRPPRPLFTA